MEKNHYVPILLGTSRKKSLSESIAKFVTHEAERFGFESNLISPRDHLEYPVTARAGIEMKKRVPWHQTMNRASALIIVSPEYNHGYPGELKLMLDMLFEEYRNKPVIVMGVSSGKLGGARMVENLLPVLISLNMHPLKNSIYFSEVEKILSERGTVKSEKYKKKVKNTLEKLQETLERKE